MFFFKLKSPFQTFYEASLFKIITEIEIIYQKHLVITNNVPPWKTLLEKSVKNDTRLPKTTTNSMSVAILNVQAKILGILTLDEILLWLHTIIKYSFHNGKAETEKILSISQQFKTLPLNLFVS